MAAMQDAAVIILCTAPATGNVAERLAHGLVTAGLAACVNLIPQVRSVYRWQGKVEDEPEVQLVIKTREGRIADVERWLTAHHPYEVPEFLVLKPTTTGASYLSWLLGQTTPSNPEGAP